MRMRSLMAFGFGIGLFALASSAQAAVLIEIDKSAQRMNVTRDGQELYSWPVSTGRGGYDTPSGSYTPFRMEADHYSKEWDDAPMPHSPPIAMPNNARTTSSTASEGASADAASSTANSTMSTISTGRRP